MVIHVAVPTPMEDTESDPVVEIRGAGESVQVHPQRIDEATWVVHWWPRETGWHRLTWRGQPAQSSVVPGVGEGRTFDLFVQLPATAWRVWQHGERQRATLALIASADPTGGATVERVRHHLPWPRGWAFVIFLLAAAYLWIDERRPRGHAARR